jgi:hypothetical protein
MAKKGTKKTDTAKSDEQEIKEIKAPAPKKSGIGFLFNK